jgi:hypothetical protein
MRLVHALSISLVLIAASTATFAQSKIDGKTELTVKAKIAFPFVEEQFGDLKWNAKNGGAYRAHFVVDREYDFECNYSCTIDVDLGANAFSYLETRGMGEGWEHDIYNGHGEAMVIRMGSHDPGGDCSFQSEFTTTINFEVADFADEEWIDLLFVFGHVEGPDEGWGPCFPPPAEADVVLDSK